MKANALQDLVYELKNIRDRLSVYIKQNDYVYAEVFRTWIKKFNHCVSQYNERSEKKIQLYEIDEWDYSSTQKTMRQGGIDSFISTLSNLIDKIEMDIENDIKQKQEKEIPYYQVRQCFKLKTEGCPVNPKLEKNKIFIGMPFNNDHLDSYNYGIKPVLDFLGYNSFRADNNISNFDIMCKVCRELQSCGLAIFNISDLNPNVMLELGLAYGIGKPVIIIKDTKTRTITDIGSIEYIEYQHAYDLQQKLNKAFSDLI